MFKIYKICINIGSIIFTIILHNVFISLYNFTPLLGLEKCIAFRIFRILKSIIMFFAITGYKIWGENHSSKLFSSEFEKWILGEKCIFINVESGLRLPLSDVVSSQTSLNCLLNSTFLSSADFVLLLKCHISWKFQTKCTQMYVLRSR